MKTNILIISILIFSITFICCSNEPSFDRVEADFIANVYLNMKDKNSYEMLGQYSILETNKLIYAFNIYGNTDTLEIILKYKWIERVEEWGYEGWENRRIEINEKQ